jgi:ubiquinone/menaquinone biosynthesis C-methylase UbiE
MDRGKVFPAANARSLLNPARRLVQSARRTVAAIGLSPEAHVLELGCGPGFFSGELAHVASRVTLFDLQAEMLQLARTRLAGSVDYAQGDGMTLPFADGAFDAVFIATVLGEIPDRAACIGEARRVLSDGGTLAIAETRRDSDFIRLPELRAVVEPRGFAFDARRGVRWQYVARFVAQP